MKADDPRNASKGGDELPQARHLPCSAFRTQVLFHLYYTVIR